MEIGKLIATRGDEIFLLEFDDEMVRVANRKTKEIFPLIRRQAVLGRGYWKEVNRNKTLEKEASKYTERDKS